MKEISILPSSNTVNPPTIATMGNSPSSRNSEKEDISVLFSSTPPSKSGNAASPTGEDEVAKKKKDLFGKMGKKNVPKEKMLTRCLPQEFKQFKHKQRINRIVIDPSFEKTNLIWSCSHDKNILAWDALNANCKKVFQGHTKAVTCIVIHENMLYSGSYDRTVRCWNIETGMCKTVYDENDNWITSLLVKDGFLYCAGYDCNVNIYDEKTCRKIKTLKGHSKRIDDMAMHDGVLYTASSDGCVRSWDIDNGKLIKVYNCREHVSSVNVYNNLLLCGQHQQLMCWDMDKFDTLAPYVGISTFTLVNDLLIGWNRINQCFEFWDLTTNTLLETIEDKNLMTTSNICFLPQSAREGTMYYSCGSQILSKTVTLPCFDVDTEETASELDISESTLSATPTLQQQESYCEQQIQSSIDLLKGPELPDLKSIHHHGTKPTYMIYPRLFNYFVNVLLHNSNFIAQIMDDLHKKNALQNCFTFDGQIGVISQQIYLLEQGIMSKNKISKTKSHVDFELLVMPIADNLVSQNMPNKFGVYSDEELQLDFETRTEVFYNRIRKTLSNENNLQPTVILVRREHLVFDTCKHFSVLAQDDLKKQMYIFFAGEEGLDMGGVTREFYQLLSAQILDPNNALFCRTPCNTYHPNVASVVNEAHLQYFRFIGKLIGKAIYDMQLMDTHFSSVIFKNIVGKPVIFEDFEMIDPSMYMAMKKLLEMDSETIEIMDMNFAAEVNDFDGNNIVPLVQDGENIKVTYENKYTFVDYYSRWKLVESVRPQLERLLSGVYDIIPREYFAIFNEKELELLLCGSPEIDLDDWKSNTRYEGGYTAESPSIVHFWEAVEEMNHTHRSKLLQFVTGTSSIPHEGFEGIFPAFTICMLRNMSQDFLPHAHTCLNRVDFPPYETKEILKKRFEQAIQHGLLGFGSS